MAEKSISVKLTANTSAYEAAMSRAAAASGKMASTTAANLSKVGSYIDDAYSSAMKLAGANVVLEIKTRDDAKAAIAEIQSQLNDLKGNDTEIGVTMRADAVAAIDKVGAALRTIDGDEVEVLMAVHDDASVRINSIDRAIRDLDGADATALLEVRDEASATIAGVEGRLRELDGAGTQAGAGLARVGDGAGRMSSMMGNMVGNAVQDLGQVVGVSGSASQALGQLGESMYDAKAAGTGMGAALADFALMAGPIAVVGAAVGIVTGVMGEMESRAAASAARVSAFGEAMAGSANDAVGLAGALREDAAAMQDFNQHASSFGGLVAENLGIVGSSLPIIGGLFDSGGANIVDIANQAGISFYQLAEAIDAGGYAGSDFNKTLLEMNDSGAITDDQLDSMLQFVDRYGANARDASDAQKLFNVDQAEANALLGDMLMQQSPMDSYADKWRTLQNDMADGTISTVAAAEAVNFLADALGKDPGEIVGMAQADMDATATAAEAAASAADQANADFDRSWAESVQAVEDAAAEAAAAVVSAMEAAWASFDEGVNAAEAFAAAFESINAASSLDFSQMAADTVESFDTMKSSLDALAEVGVDWATIDLSPDSYEELKGMPDELGAVTDAVSGMRGAIQTELQAAFESGGIDAYTAKAEFFRDEVLDQMPGKFMAMGASASEAAALTDALLTDLGLMPADVVTQLTIAHANDAMGALETFEGVINSLPTEVQIPIRAAQQSGDTDEAIRLLNEQLISYGFDPIVLETDVNGDGIADGIAEVEAQARADIVIPVVADVLEATGQLDGLTDSEKLIKIAAVADMAAAYGALDEMTAEQRTAYVTAIADTIAANGGLDNLTAEGRQATVDVIANTLLYEGKFATIEDARHAAEVLVDANLGKYKAATDNLTADADVTLATKGVIGDVPTDTSADVDLDAGGEVSGVPASVAIAANLNAGGRVSGVPASVNVRARFTNIDTAVARGGVFDRVGVQRFASGGLTDGVLAGPGATMYAWREPETQGESFIPHASGKRSRSMDILARTAAMFGQRVVPMAKGDIVAGTATTATVGGAATYDPSMPNLQLPLFMLDMFRRTGTTLLDFEQAAAGGDTAMDAYIAKLREQGEATDDLVLVMAELHKASEIALERERRRAAGTAPTESDAGGGGGGGGEAGKGDEDEAKRLEALTEAVGEYQMALTSTDWGASRLEAATTAFEDYNDSLFAAGDAIAEQHAATDGFFGAIVAWQSAGRGAADDTRSELQKVADAIAAINANGLDLSGSTEQSRTFRDALRGIADAVSGEMAAAYDAAGGDMATFMASATEIGDRVISSLQLTGEAAEAVRTALGLTAGDYEARFHLAGQEEAMLRLQLLDGALSALGNRELQIKIGALVARGEFTEALALATEALEGATAEVEATVDTDQATTDLAALTAEERVAVIRAMLDSSGITAEFATLVATLSAGGGLTIHDSGGIAGPWGGIAGESGAELVDGRLVTGPTYIGPGASVMSTTDTRNYLRGDQGNWAPAIASSVSSSTQEKAAPIEVIVRTVPDLTPTEFARQHATALEGVLRHRLRAAGRS